MGHINPEFTPDYWSVLELAGWNVRDHDATKILDFGVTAILKASGKFLIHREHKLVVHLEPTPGKIQISRIYHRVHAADLIKRAGEAEYRALHYLEAITDFMFAWRYEGPGRGLTRISPHTGRVVPRPSPYDPAVISAGRRAKLCQWKLPRPNDHTPDPWELIKPETYRRVAPLWVRVPPKVRHKRIAWVDGAERTGWVISS